MDPDLGMISMSAFSAETIHRIHRDARPYPNHAYQKADDGPEAILQKPARGRMDVLVFTDDRDLTGIVFRRPFP